MTAPDTTIGRLALIGVGLIGGSLTRSLKRAGAVAEVVGCARTTQTLDRALSLGAIDRAEEDIETAAAGADVVVIATPMQTIPAILERLEACVGPRTVVTDVGSAKGHVVDAVARCFAAHRERFVPGHPIAGKEHAGVEASSDDLFESRSVILTPVEFTDPSATATVSAMWRATGAVVEYMDAATHDRLLAATSHLPHVAAYALVDYLAQHDDSEMLFRLAAAGFYDFTRIASSDPVMWRDICLTNRVELLHVMRGYRRRIDKLISAVERSDGAALYECFEHSKRSRDAGLDRKARAGTRTTGKGSRFE